MIGRRGEGRRHHRYVFSTIFSSTVTPPHRWPHHFYGSHEITIDQFLIMHVSKVPHGNDLLQSLLPMLPHLISLRTDCMLMLFIPFLRIYLATSQLLQFAAIFAGYAFCLDLERAADTSFCALIIEFRLTRHSYLTITKSRLSPSLGL